MPQVSVVLPIYNVEVYLEQCLQSIQNQTLKDIEIICVNDGSTDSSLEIIESFAAQDNRFIVVDKENAGYGHSVNTGIAKATGTYIGIVEPDDFIDEHMYEDLLFFSTYQNESPADIVKGSYWEFFDATDEVGPGLTIPYLSDAMPKTPTVFSTEENATVLTAHPSIWSAIYRRDFLLHNKIVFKEIPGAAWVDNPFAYEALSVAKQIIWVPKPYYYYRLSNENASSNVKDYGYIFDRMRDTRSMLHSKNTSENVWAAFYARELSYCLSVINEFGFSEEDPVLKDLIQETLNDMDEVIVHGHPYISPREKAYYDTFVPNKPESLVQAAKTQSLTNTPDISFIVPVGSNASTIEAELDALAHSAFASPEIIAFNNASRDSSIEICERYAVSHPNMTLLEDSPSALYGGLNAALKRARGAYIFIYEPGCFINTEALYAALQSALNHNADLVLIDPNKSFVADAIKASRCSTTVVNTEEDEVVFVGPLAPTDAANFILNCCPPNKHCALYRRLYLEENGLAFNENDIAGGARFCANAAIACEQVLYCSCWFYGQSAYREPERVQLLNDTRYDPSTEAPLAIHGALDIINRLEKSSPYYASALHAAAEAFLYDLSTRKNYAAAQAYHETYWPTLLQLFNTDDTNKLLGSGINNNALQLLKSKGFEAYSFYAYRDMQYKRDMAENEVVYLLNSATMQLGKKVSGLAKKVVPGAAVEKARRLFRK